jgi:hypothetical protein
LAYNFKLIGAALAGAALLIAPPSARASTITMTSGGITYQFDPVAASADFSSVFTGTVFVSCSGSLIGCEGFNEPHVPPAPAPDLSQTVAFAISSDSVFFNGGPLTSTTYMQDVCGVTGLNGSGDWCFAYTYQISPIIASVAPLTDWTAVTPLPAALPLFATGLGGLALLGWRRKRKAQAVA